jgi:type I restriction enzyme S subunit
MISLKFIPLTFITSNDEIIRQIKNTVVFSHLFETCEETFFSNYIETTQYGFTASALENGSHRMLRITDIHHSKVNWESVPFCECPDDEKYLLKDNDILVARTGGTTGKSFFVENPPSNAVFASYLIRIRLKKDVNIEFINAFLNSYCFWSQIVEMKAGSAQPNVNAEKLKVLVIPDCDLETQAKAVRLIKEENSSDSIREKINSVESLFWNNNKISTELNHQLALVKELRQAYLREAMQGKLDRQDSTDEPAEILLEKIKAEKEQLAAENRIKRDKPLPPINAEEIPFEIPSNWTWCRLGEIIEFSDNLNIHTKLSDETLINYVDIDAIDNERFQIREVKEKPVSQLSSRARRILKKGFIVYSLVRPYLNNIAIIEDEKENYIGSTGFAVFNGILIENKFLKFLLLSDYIRKLYLEFISGFNSPSITNEQFQETIIPLPPLAEQERIVAKLEKLMKFCDELEANIRQGIANADQLLQTALKEALEPK